MRAAASSSLPYFGETHATPRGGAWLGEYTISTAPSSRFLVISPEGLPTHWVEFRAPIRVLDTAEDRVLGVEEDEWGVHSVVVYALTR